MLVAFAYVRMLYAMGYTLQTALQCIATEYLQEKAQISRVPDKQTEACLGSWLANKFCLRSKGVRCTSGTCCTQMTIYSALRNYN